MYLHVLEQNQGLGDGADQVKNVTMKCAGSLRTHSGPYPRLRLLP